MKTCRLVFTRPVDMEESTMESMSMEGPPRNQCCCAHLCHSPAILYTLASGHRGRELTAHDMCSLFTPYRLDTLFAWREPP